MASRIKSCEVEQVAATAGEVALAFGGVTLGGTAAGLKGRLVVENEQGTELSLGVSRLEGEAAWTVDSLSVGGRVAFANGFGARYLRTDRIASGELTAALETAAAGVIA